MSWHPGIEGYPYFAIHGFSGDAKRDTAMHDANARLIAAAPDLLEACKMVASFAVSWQPLSVGDIQEVIKAIAKAEGR